MKSLLISILFIIPIISNCQLYPITIKNESGVISQTGFIDENGEKEGEWLGYGPQNVIYYVGYYKDNKKVGTWKTFKEDGVIWSEITYKDGKRISGRIFGDNGEVVDERYF
jgi:antitoxin component YwqK of YwqJK toxin-antitoxin module